MRIIIIICILTLSACKTTVKIYDVTPATVTLPDNIRKITVLNRSTLEDGRLSELLSRNSALKSLQKELKESDNLSSNNKKIIKQLKTEKDSVFLNWNEVNKICKSTKSDALLAMEAFATKRKTSTNVLKRKTRNDKGYEVTVDLYEISDTLQVNVRWILYDTLTQKVIDDFFVGKEISRTGYGDSRSLAEPFSSFERLKLYMRLSKRMGANMFYRLTPYGEFVKRNYFVWGSKNMRTAAKLARKKDWERASLLWQTEIATTTKPKTKGKASHNMAVYLEMTENYKSATEFEKNAFDILKDYEHKFYYERLIQKEKDYPIIQKQLKRKNIDNKSEYDYVPEK